MKILIVTQYPFPFGLAQTNRLIAMAKGLVHAGCEVIVTCIKPTEVSTKIRNKDKEGEMDTVKFVYPGGKTVRSNFLMVRMFDYYKSLFRSLCYIKKENKRKGIDILFMGVTTSFNTLLFHIFSKLLHIKFIQERSEYPFLSYKNSVLGRLQLGIYLNIVCKFFDGFIVITKALEKYFRPYLKKEVPIFLLPILVETERFDQKINNPEKYITYCGSMEGNKDGVPILIDSFHQISIEFPSYKLLLIGGTNFKGFNSLQKQIEAKKLTEKVVFTGRIERDALPAYLSQSSILVLARPTSKQAEGGFPTKLGEYLATGRPVVVTKVGEIGEFLVDSQNAFISIPDSADAFAIKLRIALKDYETAKIIGLEGKKLAQTIFNYKFQGEQLLNWLKTI